MSTLILYQFDECPYCQKVDRAIRELELRERVEYRNTRLRPDFREELRALTGRTQVPCLVIDNSPMLESDDIVSWLYEQHGGGRTPPRSSWWG